MKPSNEIIYGETYEAMKKSLKLLDKDLLSKKEIESIKGAIMHGSFLYPNAIRDEMYGFMSLYADLKSKWDRRERDV